jgi:hypothetical protein
VRIRLVVVGSAPRVSLQAPQMVDAAVARDREQPGARRSFTPEALQAREGGAERILRQILGEVVLAHHGAAHRDHVARIVLDQPLSGAAQIADVEETTQVGAGRRGVHVV